MASPTRKVKRIRNRKDTANGARRKYEIRRDARAKAAEVARRLGLAEKGQLATKE